MRSAPECHLRARPDHYPMPGPRSGAHGRGAPTVRRGEADRRVNEGLPPLFNSWRPGKKSAGKRIRKRGECRAARLAPPEQLSLAGHRGSTETEAKCAPRRLSTARTHAEPVGESRWTNRDGKWQANRPPRGFASWICRIRMMRPSLVLRGTQRVEIAQHTSIRRVEG